MVLRDNLLMAGLVHRDFEKDLAVAGDTVRTRKPQKLTARSFSQQSATNATLANMTVQNLSSLEVTVVLDQHYYTAFLVEDRDASTSIKDLAAEFVVPAIDPLSDQLDGSLMTEFTTGTDFNGDTVTAVASSTVGLGSALTEDDIIAGHKAMNDNQCPPGGRNLVMSSDHDADILGRSLFHQANTAGWTRALRDAVIGKAFGFMTYMSQNVPTASDTDSTPQSLGFHRNAIALVTRPLRGPDQYPGIGAISAFRTLDNISIRVTTSYEHTAKGVIQSYDVLWGVSLLDANLATILNP